MYSALLCVVIPLLCNVIAASDFHPLSDAFIDHINKQGHWTAGRNFHPDTPMSYILQLIGTKPDDAGIANMPTVEHDEELAKSLPATFDPREKWPNCPSLSEIRDQGSCGSCWAFAAVEAMTDRVCIQSNGSQNFHFSAEDLLTCSGENNDCNGGLVSFPWEFWVREGLVSGGSYNSHEGCRPYTIAGCNHHAGVKSSKPNCTAGESTPPCKRRCDDGYTVSYKQDKRFGKRAYTISGEKNLMTELYLNGPVEVSFQVYADFLHYKHEVYQRVNDDFLGNHAVKMLGWGEEGGKKYWLIANSWNEEWGNKGYFKILRGVNECGIEDNATAGEPRL